MGLEETLALTPALSPRRGGSMHSFPEFHALVWNCFMGTYVGGYDFSDGSEATTTAALAQCAATFGPPRLTFLNRKISGIQVRQMAPKSRKLSTNAQSFACWISLS